MLKYAIIGLGGLGKAHFGYSKTVCERTGAKLVAICDIEESAFKKKVSTNLGEDESGFDFTGINLYTDSDEMFEKEELDFVLTALPTYIHEEVAVKAMERGLHVFSEKPMAINLEQAQHMLDVSKKQNVKLMIGQCVRYFPAYQKLKEFVDNKELGKVLRVDFERLSSWPRWSWHDWFLDESLSGGSILDLHVHDVDFINYVFGMPKAVASIATNDVTKHDSVSTLFYYDDVSVSARGSWREGIKYPFTATFHAVFENATVVCGRDGKLMVYPGVEEEEVYEVELGNENGYVEELVDFVNCIENDCESKINPPEASLKTVEIALAEKKSVDLGEIVRL